MTALSTLLFMISTAHVLIGGAVGMAVGAATHSPALALVAGVASHFAMDSIPHLDHPPAPHKNGHLVWTPAIWIFAFVDTGLAAIITFALWYTHFGYPTFSPFLAGALGGVLPDLIDNVPFWNHWFRPLLGFKQFHAFHESTHTFWRRILPMPQEAKLPTWWLWGIVTQLVAAGLSLVYLWKA